MYNFQQRFHKLVLTFIISVHNPVEWGLVWSVELAVALYIFGTALAVFSMLERRLGQKASEDVGIYRANALSQIIPIPGADVCDVSHNISNLALGIGELFFDIVR